jgi:hypothetical protein
VFLIIYIEKTLSKYPRVPTDCVDAKEESQGPGLVPALISSTSSLVEASVVNVHAKDATDEHDAA